MELKQLLQKKSIYIRLFTHVWTLLKKKGVTEVNYMTSDEVVEVYEQVRGGVITRELFALFVGIRTSTLNEWMNEAKQPKRKKYFPLFGTDFERSKYAKTG